MFYTPPRFGTSLFAPGGHPDRTDLANNVIADAAPKYTRALRGGLDDPAFPTPARAGPEASLLLDVVVHLSIGFGAMVLTDKITQQAVLHQDWNDQRVQRWTIVRGLVRRSGPALGGVTHGAG